MTDAERVLRARKDAIFWRREQATGKVLSALDIEYIICDLEKAGGLR